MYFLPGELFKFIVFFTGLDYLLKQPPIFDLNRQYGKRIKNKISKIFLFVCTKKFDKIIYYK